MTMEQQVKQADVIFVAKVIEIKDLEYENIRSTLMFKVDSTYMENAGFNPILEVDTIYKGELNHPSYSTTIPYECNWSNCDILFEREKTYLIFAYLEPDGRIKTNVCTKTKQFTPEMVKELSKLEW